MQKNRIILVLILLALLAFTPAVLAGGGLVSFEVSPSLVRPGEEYTVRPQVYADQYGGTPCRQCSIAIKFESPQSGDAISQSDSKTDSNGTMSAKVLSQQVGERTIYAEVTMPDGSIYQSSRYVLYYDNKVQPSGSIAIKIDNQKILSGNVRQVSLSWNSVPDALDYFVSARPVTSTSYGPALVDTRKLSGQITINTSPDYFVKVSACSVYGRCIESAEVKISQIKQETISTPVAKPLITPSPKVTVSIKSSPAPLKETVASPSNNVKVEDRTQSLEKPNKKPSFWAERINSIVNWLKSIFPVFK